MAVVSLFHKYPWFDMFLHCRPPIARSMDHIFRLFAISLTQPCELCYNLGFPTCGTELALWSQHRWNRFSQIFVRVVPLIVPFVATLDPSLTNSQCWPAWSLEIAETNQRKNLGFWPNWLSTRTRLVSAPWTVVYQCVCAAG